MMLHFRARLSQCNPEMGSAKIRGHSRMNTTAFFQRCTLAGRHLSPGFPHGWLLVYLDTRTMIAWITGGKVHRKPRVKKIGHPNIKYSPGLRLLNLGIPMGSRLTRPASLVATVYIERCDGVNNLCRSTPLANIC